MKDKRQGHTRPVQNEERAPRMPHERDESSDSQVHNAPQPAMKQAHDDVAAGRVDTDRGPPMDETYKRQKESPVPGARKRS